ncbi:hypothetical protein HHI36_000866 [Cryptolaemus montrouzieri]|uniref:Uncharacterized protein n=1 Tax=Cryptolaemus montrouzieri TaxID=559131 RepID=A0ABD2P6A2_9CUCU
MIGSMLHSEICESKEVVDCVEQQGESSKNTEHVSFDVEEEVKNKIQLVHHFPEEGNWMMLANKKKANENIGLTKIQGISKVNRTSFGGDKRRRAGWFSSVYDK